MNQSEDFQADITALQKRVEDLESSLQSVLQEKRIQEADFAQKRAKFKELFLTREDELIKEAKTVQEERDRLREELLGLKAAAAVIESSKQEEIEDVKRRWQEEVASIQQVMNDATAVVAQETAMAYHQERDKLLTLNQDLTEELSEIKEQSRKSGSFTDLTGGSNILHGFTKTFRNLAGPGTSSPTREEKPGPTTKEENLEDSMMKAQKDADLLKALVLPLESEIESLKQTNDIIMEENRLLHAQLQKYTEQSAPEADQTQRKSDAEDTDIDQKFQKLKEDLEREKAGRTDLELFVAVLQKQKVVSQEDVDKLGQELKDVCKLLESEQANHQSLRQTWQMANDQFLESQRLQMMDLRRLESVLSEEQQRQVMELQKKDNEREEQEKRVKELEARRAKHNKEIEERIGKQEPSQPRPIPVPTRVLAPTPPNTPNSPSFFSPSSGMSNTPNINPNDLLEFAVPSFQNGVPSLSSQPMKIWEIDGSSFDDSGVTKTSASQEEETIPSSPNISLTEAQEQAIMGITPEKEEIQEVLESVRSKQEEYPSLEGKRVVSEEEWMRLQEQIRNASDNVGKPCNMCSNYEVQVQTLQNEDQKQKDTINSLRLQLTIERDRVEAEHKVRMELEESLKNAAEDAQSQITILRTKNTESDANLAALKHQYRQAFTDVQTQAMQLAKSRDEVHQEVKNLQRENENLSKKRELHSSLMNDDTFILPSTLEELQTLCFKYREDMVTMKVNTEHEKDMLRGKMEFLKGQHDADRHAREALEQTLQVELEEYKDECILLRSIRDEYERERKTREELETALKDAQENRKTFQMKSEEETDGLKEEVTGLRDAKAKLESEVHGLRLKSQGLQTELGNSEAVQMDFVKLSQSLQVELEKIRQSENEVRWEHEDDVDNCFSCKTNFGSSKKKKAHCKHCGKVFCPDCVTKSVESGRRKRKVPVCDVCHTLLVNDSAPYFSKEAPPTT